jgi:hypothetical protein
MSGSTSPRTKFTKQELNATFGDGKSKLPLLQNPNTITSSERQNGLLTSAKVTQIIANLKKQGIVPSYTGSNEQKVNEKLNSLLANGQEEFNFYFIRYKSSLDTIYDYIAEYALSPDKANIDRVNQLLNAELVEINKLNTKLNDLIQILLGIIADLEASTTSLTNGISKLKSRLQWQRNTLVNQKKILSSEEAVTKLNKEMVKYTEEKARYSNNLLTVYSVLNVVALGLLVYVFRSTTD